MQTENSSLAFVREEFLSSWKIVHHLVSVKAKNSKIFISFMQIWRSLQWKVLKLLLKFSSIMVLMICPVVDIISFVVATSLDAWFSALFPLTKHCFNRCITSRLVLVLVLPERNTNSMPVDCQWLIKDSVWFNACYSCVFPFPFW